MRDGGRSPAIGLQERVANHRKRRGWSHQWGPVHRTGVNHSPRILILGIGDLDPVAKEAKDEGIAVAQKPVPSIKDRSMRYPSDVYLSRVDVDGRGVVQMAANRFVDNEAKDAGRIVTGTVLVVGAGWTSL